jgi:thiol:disulfide interchange protein DsbA
MFRDDFVPLQKLYYALEAMNRVDDMHRKVFNAIHVDKKVLNRDEPIINWVAAQGVDKAKFTEAYNSFGVSTKVRKATQLQDAYKLAGVPAMGIAGKYYTDGTLAQSMDRALVVTDYLVAEQRGKAK